MIRLQSFSKPGKEALNDTFDIVACTIFHLTTSTDAARFIEGVDWKDTLQDRDFLLFSLYLLLST